MINVTPSLSLYPRASKDVSRQMDMDRAYIKEWHANEVIKLDNLQITQCVKFKCKLLFNTSSLMMTGAMNATGIDICMHVYSYIYMYIYVYLYLHYCICIQCLFMY
jgi:hypothetical protein